MLRNEVFDKSLKRIGLIENFNFCQYTKKLRECGTFSLQCALTEENLEMLQKENLIWLENNIMGIIQNVEISDDIQINGSLMEVMLDWRYIYPVFNKNESPIQMMYDVVSDNCINSLQTNRNFNNLILINIEDEEQKIIKQKTGGSVLEFCIELSEAYDLGFTINFNPENRIFEFKVIKGEDRTINNQIGNKKIIFSDSLNNLGETKYSYDSDKFRNIALVAGESETKERVITYSYYSKEEATGFDRRELYVDARDLQSEITDENGNEIKMAKSEYMEVLYNRGLEKLSENKIVESLEAEVINNSDTLFVFGKDYFLGDYVTVIKESYNYLADVQVTEVVVTQDKNDYTVSPVFGEGKPTLYSILKKKGVIN